MSNKSAFKIPSLRGDFSDTTELHHLLFAISKFFPMIIYVNLTQNKYKMLEYESFTTKKAAIEGNFDDLVNVGVETVHPLHKKKFYDTFCRENLLKAYASGEESVVLDVRQLSDQGEYGWVKTSVIFLTNEENDEVLEITLARPFEQEKVRELDNQRLRTVLDMALLGSYEYVSLINVKTGMYENYATDGKESHQAPPNGNYDKSIMYIRDLLVPEEDRIEYFNRAKLSTVVAKMKEIGGHYHFRYRINTSLEPRWYEAMYQYCLPDKDELLLTVQDISNAVIAEQSKLDLEISRRNLERQQFLKGLGFDILIDIDLLSSKAELFGDTKSLLKREIILDNFPRGEIEAGMVHPEDVQIVYEVLDFSNLSDTFTLDFRFKHGDGKYFWCRCKGLVIKDENKIPYRCICKFTDIDEHKKSELKLLHKTQIDSLTGLYNKLTTEILVNEYLSGEGVDSRHGLLVLDLDNFKLVNDNWGHKSGDDLLQLIAKTLKESVRASDIVGRIGGDEFVALLKNIDSATDVIEKANVIRSRIKAIRLDEVGDRFIPAFSVGIGLYPEHGNAYENIFELADAAMYYVKNHGKDGVKLS